MLIPIGDDNIAGGARPVITYTFIIMNIAIFFYEHSLGNQALHDFVNQYGTIPVDAMSGNHLYTFLSSMFLHGGWSHLIGNMLFLWIFGDNVEAVIGNGKFLLFFLVGGMIASATHVWMNPESTIPSLGASGAISAVLGAYLIMFPRSRVKMFFLIFFITFYISAIFFIGFWFIQQFMSAYGQAGLDAQSQGVAWWAHIGGFIFGIFFGFFYRSRAKEFNFVPDPRSYARSRRYR